MPSNRIRGFDGIRAIAFLLVFVSHKILLNVTDRLGSVAVWIFFVLSGFLITRILAAQRSRIEMGELRGREALTAFYRSRVFRIFPPYYALLFVLSALAATGHYDLETGSRQLANWLFYSNVFIERHGWHGDLGHLWSLAVEQQYYLFFAPLVLFLPRALLPGICAGLLAASVAANVYFLAEARPQTTFDVNSVVNIGLFGFGGLAGLFAHRPLPKVLLNAPAIALVFCMILAFPTLVPNPWFSETCRPAVGALAACLLVQISQCQKSSAVELLDLAPIRWLGVISYAAYLFHPVIHSEVLVQLLGFSGPLPMRWRLAMDLAITVALASASWALLENPLMRFSRRRRNERPSHSPALPKI